MQAAERRRERRERDAEAARSALLAAAETIFARDGFSGARVDDIAAAAGYNKALIFHYFGDKLGLYQTLIARIKQENGERIGELMHRLFPDNEATPDPKLLREFIAQAVGWTFDSYRTHPGLPRMLAWEAAEGWQTYTACPMPPGQIRWITLARDLIQRAQAAGIVRAEVDPELLIANIMGMSLIYQISVPRYQGLFPEKDLGSAEAMAHAREQFIALIEHGILVPPFTESTAQEAVGEAEL